jgi:hypothetical protein
MAATLWYQDGVLIAKDGALCLTDDCPCAPVCDYFEDPVSALAMWTVESGTWTEV